MSYLALVRHGETEWNTKGLFTGQTDTPLNERGKDQARVAADSLKDISFTKGYTSNLSRSKDTLQYILETLQQNKVEIIEAKELTERNYGVFEGKSKQEAILKYGEDQVHKLRRAWNYPVEQGETLKTVYERIVPYYKEHILKDLLNNKNVIISGHNNTMRALITYIENLSESEVESLELENGEVIVYELDNNGTVLQKHIAT